MIGIDLFSGAGGMSLGATLAGVKVKVAVDSDQFAGETFVKNHPNVKLINQSILLSTIGRHPKKRIILAINKTYL